MGELKRHPDRYINIVMAFLAIVLIVLFAALIKQYLDLRQARILNDQAIHFSLAGRREPLPNGRADIIQAWMTFDYVNRIFGLPPQYLISALNIESAAYPRIPIYEYAEKRGLNPTAFTKQVQSAVAEHQAANSQ
ncbi:hypothetical protein M1432_00130 [Patescibacteria group bacterium]|nr:hypothetical protein [Patescibacteria group bacterium]